MLFESSLIAILTAMDAPYVLAALLALMPMLMYP